MLVTLGTCQDNVLLLNNGEGHEILLTQDQRNDRIF